MVLTRAQSNQSKTPGVTKAADHETAGLKAPAKRGRSKKDEAPKPTTIENKPRATRKAVATQKTACSKEPALATTKKATARTRKQLTATTTQRRTAGKRIGKKITEEIKLSPEDSQCETIEAEKSAQAEDETKNMPAPSGPRKGIELSTSPSKIPLPVASPQRPPSRDTPLQSVYPPTPTVRNCQASTPSRMPTAIMATSSPMKSSVVASGKAGTLGSPRKAPATPKALLSPAKTHFGPLQSVQRPGPPIRFMQETEKSPKEPNSLWEPPNRMPPSLAKSCLRRSAERVVSAPTNSIMSTSAAVESENDTTSAQIQPSPRKTVSFRTSQAPSEIPEYHILDGVRIFVDIRCANGDNGSAPFESLLNELGAEVVPIWTTNVNRSPGKDAASELTHVLWANGCTRTLEKVLATNGAVKCVNLSWPLDCEKYNIRLPETKYLIDFWLYLPQPSITTPLSPVSPNSPSKAIPTVPPTPVTAVALSTAFKPPAITATPARNTFFSPLKNAMGSFLIKTPSYFAGMQSPAKASTDEGKENICPQSKDKTEDKTPLVQRTCPPKHVGRRLWMLDEVETPVRSKLTLKRRMSQEF